MNKLVENGIDQSHVLIDIVVTFALDSFLSLGQFGKSGELGQTHLVLELVQLRAVLVQDRVNEIILGVLFDFALKGENS